MIAFLKNLDRKAERWVNALDEDLQAPLVRTMTGDVFTHGALSQEANDTLERQQHRHKQDTVRGSQPTFRTERPIAEAICS